MEYVSTTTTATTTAAVVVVDDVVGIDFYFSYALAFTFSFFHHFILLSLSFKRDWRSFSQIYLFRYKIRVSIWCIIIFFSLAFCLTLQP